MYDGGSIVSKSLDMNKPVIYVSMNYRYVCLIAVSGLTVISFYVLPTVSPVHTAPQCYINLLLMYFFVSHGIHARQGDQRRRRG